MLNHYCQFRLAKKIYNNNMRLTIVLILLFISFSVFSQNALRFDNVITKDTIWVFENDKAVIQYKGYLNQTEEIKGRILLINDTVLFIGSKLFGTQIISKRIKISDISGFRKFTRVRRILKTSLNIIVIAGSIYLPEALNVKSSIGIYATSLSSGLVGVGIIELIFSNKVKNTLNTGWKHQIMYPKPKTL